MTRSRRSAKQAGTDCGCECCNCLDGLHCRTNDGCAMSCRRQFPVEFFTPGHPAPQGSKRHVGRGILIESSKAVGPWRERVALAAHQAMAGRFLLEGPITLRLEFVMPRPLSAPKRRTPPAIKRPDCDKLARACLDALTGVIYIDDAQVVDLHVRKRIAEIGETPGVHIRAETT